jgi:predicted tellurium resistance membrane protein TerC
MELVISAISLAAMEIVLGIDNVIFIAILVGRLPQAQRARARTLGLSLALITRLMLLFAISWIMTLTQPFLHIPYFNHEISGKDLILLAGGLFLIGKSTYEIYHKLEVSHAEQEAAMGAASFTGILAQIILLDIVFSLDSVITAVGIVSNLAVIVTAILIAVGIMLLFAGVVSDFVDRHPSMKILALAFLLLIGVLLVAEGWGEHIEKGYIYFAMAFSVFIELLNMRLRRKQQQVVHLHHSLEGQTQGRTLTEELKRQQSPVKGEGAVG